MEQRLTYITLGVEDLKRSTTFYKDVFGWVPSPSSNDNITFFSLNGIVLGLFNAHALAEDASVASMGSGFSRFTLSHNVRSEKEVDDLVSTLASRGANIVKKPQKVFWGGYSSYVADPDGHLWEIAYNPYLEMDSVGNVIR